MASVRRRRVHEYVADPQSGAGNCRHCGAARDHRQHPHAFRAAASQPAVCVCGFLPGASVHK